MLKRIGIRFDAFLNVHVPQIHSTAQTGKQPQNSIFSFPNGLLLKDNELQLGISLQKLEIAPANQY